MDTSMNTSSALAQTSSDAIGMTLLRKAIDVEGRAAMQLINAIPQPSQPNSANLPPNLGQNINTTA